MARDGSWLMADGIRRIAGLGVAAISLQSLAMPTAGCSRAPQRSAARAPSVLLVTIDTLRADRIGVGTAPALDALAASAVRFTAARTTVPLTLPAHASIHTGLMPPAHGVRENGAVLDGSRQTLARTLKAAGYDTAAFIGAFVLDRRFGLAQGFDAYDDQIPRDPNATERLEAERPAAAVVDRALAWLQQRTATSAPRPAALPDPTTRRDQSDSRRPFFVWLHLYDPHAPYEPPAEFRRRAKTPYDGEITYADAQLARFFAFLRDSGQLDRTIVVVAGDHGEGLGNHGERTHGMLLYDSTLRVPLIVSAPGRAPAVRDEAVSLIDIAPTILHAAGVAVPDSMKGLDLLATVRLKPDTTSGGGLQADRDLYSETDYPRVAGWSPLQALTDGRWKAIRAGGATELYDLQRDAGEEHDLAAVQASIATAMAARADAIHGAASSVAPAVSSEAQERLRALGYVASSASANPSAAAPNPAAHIAAWNDFETALSALSAHRTDALPALQQLAASNPDAPVIQATYARALKESGRLRDALAVSRRAAHRWPTDAALLHDLAVTARDTASMAPASGDARAIREEAARADRAALVLDPNSAVAHNGLGLLAIDDERPADAAASFERATASDPNNASYWTNLGNARRALGDRVRADQAYRKALDVEPRAADAANGIGVLLVEANRPADAVPYFERAIAAAPDLVEARLNLGIAWQQSGQTARAVEAYRQVLAASATHRRERDAAAKLLAAIGAVR
jgi:choline-sulfatase